MDLKVVDIAVVVPFLAVLFFWTRGVWKRSTGDLILTAAVLVMAIGVYGYFYRLTVLADVPWVFLLICAGSAASIAVAKRKDAPARKAAAICAVTAACLSAVLFAAEDRWNASANSLMVIEPYRRAGTWAFDDPRAGLQGEPFVNGVPEWIDALLEKAAIRDPDQGFRLIFSGRPFPNYQTEVQWRRRDMGGNWYYSDEFQSEGWLCPALFQYFKRAPRAIYISVEPK